MTLFLLILYFSPKMTACRSSARLSSLDSEDDTGEGKGSHITGISLALGCTRILQSQLHCGRKENDLTSQTVYAPL